MGEKKEKKKDKEKKDKEKKEEEKATVRSAPDGSDKNTLLQNSSNKLLISCSEQKIQAGSHKCEMANTQVKDDWGPVVH